MVCAAICHKINWDILRQSAYKYTKEFSNWLESISLSKITCADVETLLKEYDKSKIKLEQRSKILREIGQYLVIQKTLLQTFSLYKKI